MREGSSASPGELGPIYQAMADAYRRMGDFERAVSEVQHAIEVAEDAIPWQSQRAV